MNVNRILTPKRMLIALGVLAMIVWWWGWGPYSRPHFRQIHAIKLHNDVKNWQLLHKPATYGRTNGHNRVYLTSTDVSDGTNTFRGVMSYEDGTLGSEVLIATEDGQVFCRKRDETWRIFPPPIAH